MSTAKEIDAALDKSGLSHGKARRFLLIDTCSLDYDVADQDLYFGDLVGLPYFPLDAARLRHYGGTTNH